MHVDSRELPMRHKIPVTKTVKYWKGLEEGRIYKTICRKCGREYHPPQTNCSFCGRETEWAKVNGEGIIEAFTTVHAIPKGFEWSGPYTIAIASFGNVRVMGWAENVKVGDRVRAYTAKDESGVWKIYFEVI